MRFDIITIFPESFDSYLNASILKRAREKKLIEIIFHNPRDFVHDAHKTARPTERRQSFGRVDDKPYGGGAGMVMKAEPILKAAERAARRSAKKGKTKTIVLSAKGKPFDQKMAYDFSKKYDSIVLISGRYEGIDERVAKALKAEEVSIGPYVLTDGDAAAMVIISAVSRLVPGVIKLESLAEESHWNLLLRKERNIARPSGLEYPHYTRPEVLKYKGKNYSVPPALLSGDHKKIEAWRVAHGKKTGIPKKLLLGRGDKRASG